MNNDLIKTHYQEANQRANTQAADQSITQPAEQFFARSHQLQYSYNFSWLNRPIIQYPQDIVAFHELVSNVQPKLIIETGIAHGGSLALSASLLCVLDVMEDWIRGNPPAKSSALTSTSAPATAKPSMSIPFASRWS